MLPADRLSDANWQAHVSSLYTLKNGCKLQLSIGHRTLKPSTSHMGVSEKGDPNIVP